MRYKGSLGVGTLQLKELRCCFDCGASPIFKVPCSEIQAERVFTVNSIKLETGLRPNSAGIPYTLLLRTEAIGFPTFGLLL